MSYWKVSRHGQHQLGAMEVTGDAHDVTAQVLEWKRRAEHPCRYTVTLPDHPDRPTLHTDNAAMAERTARLWFEDTSMTATVHEHDDEGPRLVATHGFLEKLS